MVVSLMLWAQEVEEENNVRVCSDVGGLMVTGTAGLSDVCRHRGIPLGCIPLERGIFTGVQNMVIEVWHNWV